MLRVIDVYQDIIVPEMIAAGIHPATVGHSDYDAVRDGLEDLGPDPEAEFVRDTTDRLGTLPRTRFPLGGELYDVTWAFLQATGARPEQWEIDEALEAGQGGVLDGVTNTFRPTAAGEAATHVLDPLTGQPVFPINPNLPSLNRLPGIIFVPVGLFPICGTIILFGGQQIVGVSSGPNGSRILKYGDGPCIRTQNPTNLADDRQMTALRSIRRLTPQRDAAAEAERVGTLLHSFSNRFDRMEALREAPAPHPPGAPRPAWLDASAEVRKETMAKTLMASEFSGFCIVRLRSFRIEQTDWAPAAQPGAALRARPPIENDELADPLQPAGYSHHVGGLRPSPLLHSSVGIDLVGCGNSIVEDLAITGFRWGAGIRSRPRALPGGAQFAYVNQIRHCELVDCHVGILLHKTLGFEFGSENDDRLARSLTAAEGGPNSTVIFDCHITHAEVIGGAPFLPEPRAGIELWAPTSTVAFCSVSLPATRGLGCVVTLSQFNTIYRCRLEGSRRHILCPPVAVYTPYPKRPIKLGQAVEQPDGSGFHLQRLTTRVSGVQSLFYNRFFQRGTGAVAAPRIETVEFTANQPRFGLLLAHDNLPTSEQLRASPRRFVDVSDESRSGFMPQANLEVASEVRSLQTGWTSTNVLRNTFFERTEADPNQPEGWAWDLSALPEAWRPGLGIRLINPGEPAFTGRAMEVTFQLPPQVRPADEPTTISIRFFQMLVNPFPVNDDGKYQPAVGQARGAWAERSRFRGNRLVGGVWARSNQPASMLMGFSQTAIPFPAKKGPVLGRSLWRGDDWLFLTAMLRVKDLELPEWSAAPLPGRTGELDLFAIGFFVEIRLSDAAMPAPLVVRFGAPQVNLGPDLFPLGPAPLVDQVYGNLKLARGLERTEKTRIGDGQKQGSSLIGIPARLEKVFVDAEYAQETKPSRFVVELLGEKQRRPLCEFSLAPDGRSEMTQPLTEEVALVPGDLVVTRLVGGPARAVEVYLQLVHSQVV